MTTSATKQPKFTIRTANQTLPLVRMIVDDIVVLSKQIKETRERLDYLCEGRPPGEDDEYSKELQSIQISTDEKSKLLDRFLRELLNINAVPTSADDGFVDFPAVRESEEVYLCWRQGEDEVMHWHLANEDCSKRRPIDLPLIRQSGELPISNPV